jgi:hypothetical protein
MTGSSTATSLDWLTGIMTQLTRVNRAFVVDESARPELADGYEAGPVQVLVRPPSPPGGDPCRQRQAPEVEAGQETLRRYPADHDRVAMEKLHEAGTLLAALGVRGGGCRGRATMQPALSRMGENRSATRRRT